MLRYDGSPPAQRMNQKNIGVLRESALESDLAEG
jgi:hypothetical protein